MKYRIAQGINRIWVETYAPKVKEIKKWWRPIPIVYEDHNDLGWFPVDNLGYPNRSRYFIARHTRYFESIQEAKDFIDRVIKGTVYIKYP